MFKRKTLKIKIPLTPLQKKVLELFIEKLNFSNPMLMEPIRIVGASLEANAHDLGDVFRNVDHVALGDVGTRKLRKALIESLQTAILHAASPASENNLKTALRIVSDAKPSSRGPELTQPL